MYFRGFALIFSFLYVLAFSVASVLIQKLYSSISPFFSLLITAIIATVYFNLVNVGKLKKLYRDCWKEKKLWLAVMITILIMWNCTMNGPGLLGASFYTFLVFAWLGVLGYVSLGLKEKNKIALYTGVCILVLIFVGIGLVFQSFSLKTALGVVVGLIGGGSVFIYFKQSQALIKRVKLPPTQILAVRFYLTIIVLFIFVPKDSFSVYLNLDNVSYLVFLAFISLIIPLYFSQKALEHISSEQHAIINSLCPIFAAVLQEWFFRDLNWNFVFIYVLYSATIAGSYCMTRIQKRKKSCA